MLLRQSSTKMSEQEEGVTYNIKFGVSKFNLYFAVFSAYLAPAAAGFAVGWSSPSLELLKAPGSEFPVTTSQMAWLASLTPLGAAIGPLISGCLLNSLGRRRMFLLLHLMMLIAWGLMWFNYLWTMYTARLLMGMAVGVSMAVTSIYIGELADDSLRSTINTMYPLFNKSPLLLTFGIGPYISYHSLVYISCVPSLVFLFLYKALPESPLFLFMKNRDSEAIETLSWLRQLPESSVVEEAKIIKNSLINNDEGSWINLFSKRSNVRALIIVASLQFFWQYSWGSVVIVYAQSIIGHTGISLPSGLCAFALATMTCFGTFLAPVLVRLLGYKGSLLVSSVVCTLNMGVCAYFLGLCELGDKTLLVQWFFLISLIGFVISNYSGFYPISMSLMGEYFEANMKAKGSTALMCLVCFESSVAIYMYPKFIQLVDMSVTYWFSAAILFLSTVFVAIFVPETSGLSFAQIQEILNKKIFINVLFLKITK